MTLAERVRRASRAGAPDRPVKIGGVLHESAAGAIHLASYKNRAAGDPDALILKTIELGDQNVWAIVQHKRTTARGIDQSKIVMMTMQKSEAIEWLECFGPADPNLSVAKVAYAWAPCQRDGATKALLCNEYLNEALVGHIVTKNLQSVPHFIGTRDFWISGATGLVLQDYGAHSLLKCMADLSIDEFKSIVAQTLVALAIGQESVALKHHDVHLDNVFVVRLKQTDPLLQQPVWSYSLKKPDGTRVTVCIKHCGVLAKLGDFGLGSATDPETAIRVERLDYPILDGADIEWGHWNGQFKANEAYDALVFLSKFCMRDEGSKATGPQRQWAAKLYTDACAADPKLARCSFIGRPYRGAEGSLWPAQLFELPCLSEFLDGPDLRLRLWPTIEPVQHVSEAPVEPVP